MLKSEIYTVQEVAEPHYWDFMNTFERWKVRLQSGGVEFLKE